MTGLTEFTRACFEAAEFTDFNSDSEISAGSKWAEDTRLDLEADCRSWWHRFGCFVEVCEESFNIDDAASKAGHDFWLTRNGHGAGFWDGDWDHTPYADKFTESSKAYGTFNLGLGDDGLVYS